MSQENGKKTLASLFAHSAEHGVKPSRGMKKIQDTATKAAAAAAQTPQVTQTTTTPGTSNTVARRTPNRQPLTNHQLKTGMAPGKDNVVAKEIGKVIDAATEYDENKLDLTDTKVVEELFRGLADLVVHEIVDELKLTTVLTACLVAAKADVGLMVSEWPAAVQFRRNSLQTKSKTTDLMDAERMLSIEKLETLRAVERLPMHISAAKALRGVGTIPFVEKSKRKAVADSVLNCRVLFAYLGITLRFDEFADETLVTFQGVEKALTDSFVAHVETLANANGFRAKRKFLDEQLKAVAREASFDSLCDYLDGLKWDGVPRIDTWVVNYLGAEDTPLHRQKGRRTLIGFVQRAYEPGSKFDYMLLMIGPQGGGKSSVGEALVPHGDWFSDCVEVSGESKEILETSKGVWIAEDSELAGMGKRAAEKVKRARTRKTDVAREAYGHNTTKRGRRFGTIGTSNGATPLTDKSGNRRYWPMTVGKLDPEGIARVRDQLWAEAVAAYNAGEIPMLDAAMEAAALEAQLDRTEVDHWQEHIEEYLTRATAGLGSTAVVAVRPAYLHERVMRNTGMMHEGDPRLADIQRIVDIAAGLGWHIRKVRIGSSTVRRLTNKAGKVTHEGGAIVAPVIAAVPPSSVGPATPAARVSP